MSHSGWFFDFGSPDSENYVKHQNLEFFRSRYLWANVCTFISRSLYKSATADCFYFGLRYLKSGSNVAIRTWIMKLKYQTWTSFTANICRAVCPKFVHYFFSIDPTIAPWPIFQFLVRSGQVWRHTPEQRVAASTLRRYPLGLRLAIAQADARPDMPASLR